MTFIQRCNMSCLFKKELYTDEVYVWHKKYAEEYELSTGEKLFKSYKPESVVDFGCGIGSYLLAADVCRVRTIQGYEIGGEYAKKYTNSRLHDSIDFNIDITKPLTDPKVYDMVLCVEVAEHVEPSGSKILVRNLSEHTSIYGLCVFTAAPPGQEGHQHINCRPKKEWEEMFNMYGMEKSEKDTEKVSKLWDKAPDYVLNNLAVYRHVDD